jgi:hypothetical protein|tara:strand:- start:206 stop:1129 length:924 start_codon:yes stop_codon:yes gene_type:complete
MTKKYLPEDQSTWGKIEPLGEYSMRGDIFDLKDIKELENLGYDARQENLKKHFLTPEVQKVRAFTEYRTHTGRPLAERINKEDVDLVIDCGCGFNYFGATIKNCIGVDMIDYNATDGLPGPDLVMDINNSKKIFSPECADYIICVGPFNFGPESQIRRLLETFHYLLKPNGRIVGHLRPGQELDHDKSLYRGYHHMPWTIELAEKLFPAYGFNIEWIGEEATDLTWMPDNMLHRHLETWEQTSKTVGGPTSSPALEEKLMKTLQQHDILGNITNEMYRRSNDNKYDKDKPNFVRSRIAIELTKNVNR